MVTDAAIKLIRMRFLYEVDKQSMPEDNEFIFYIYLSFEFKTVRINIIFISDLISISFHQRVFLECFR